MSKKILYTLLAVLCLKLGAFSQENTNSQGLEYSLGLNYLSGYSDLIDAYERVGYEFDFESPLGLNFAISSEYNSGLGWEANLGPAIAIFGDLSAFIMPIDLLATYEFAKDANISPFVKLGGSYILANGDFLGATTPGVKGAVGIAFNKNQKTEYGVQLSLNTAYVDFEYYRFIDEIKPYEFVLGVFAKF